MREWQKEKRHSKRERMKEKQRERKKYRKGGGEVEKLKPTDLNIQKKRTKNEETTT